MKPENQKKEAERQKYLHELGIDPHFNLCRGCPMFDPSTSSCREGRHPDLKKGVTIHTNWCNERMMDFFTSDKIKRIKVDDLKKVMPRPTRQSIMWNCARIARVMVGSPKVWKYVEGECDDIRGKKGMPCDHFSDGCDNCVGNIKVINVGSGFCRSMCMYSRNKPQWERNGGVYCAYNHVQKLMRDAEDARKRAVEVDDIESWVQYNIIKIKRDRALGRDGGS